LKEVLEKFDFNSDGIEAISLFELPVSEIQEDKRFMHKYVVALLHSALHIDLEDILCITEGKQHKNVKKLESSIKTNIRKREQEEEDFYYVYSIVTTGRGWHFLEEITLYVRMWACVEKSPATKR
ncbi:9386_t:CDS:2, partial [Acaulospora morrowiae]